MRTSRRTPRSRSPSPNPPPTRARARRTSAWPDDVNTDVAHPDGFRTGMVAIVGRPNVGTSTLLNRFVGQKVSITSRKAQTTRHRILGIATTATAQFVFVDTPGFQTRHKSLLHKSMQRAI